MSFFVHLFLGFFPFAFYFCRFQKKYELVGTWRLDPNVKEKGKGRKPSGSTSNLTSSSSSSSSTPQNNNVEDSIIASDGEVSVDSDYTSHLVEISNVRVERAKRRKAKVPCLQPFMLTRSQRAIASAAV